MESVVTEAASRKDALASASPAGPVAARAGAAAVAECVFDATNVAAALGLIAAVAGLSVAGGGTRAPLVFT